MIQAGYCDCLEPPNRTNDHRVTVLRVDSVTWCRCVGWWGCMSVWGKSIIDTRQMGGGLSSVFDTFVVYAVSI